MRTIITDIRRVNGRAVRGVFVPACRDFTQSGEMGKEEPAKEVGQECRREDYPRAGKSASRRLPACLVQACPVPRGFEGLPAVDAVPPHQCLAGCVMWRL